LLHPGKVDIKTVPSTTNKESVFIAMREMEVTQNLGARDWMDKIFHNGRMTGTFQNKKAGGRDEYER
jgi:hypothetical protein